MCVFVCEWIGTPIDSFSCLLFSQVRPSTTIENLMALLRLEHTIMGSNFLAIPNEAFLAVRRDDAWENCLDPTKKVLPMFSDGAISLSFIVVLEKEPTPKKITGRR